MLFGRPQPPEKPYVDKGLLLTKELTSLLNLSDWVSGLPDFTEEEVKAMDREIASFPVQIDEPMRRTLGAQALR
jgi:hypothetical protein